MKIQNQRYYLTAIICMMVLSCTQLFLNLNDGWKETDIEDLQAKVLQVEGMVKDEAA